MARHPAAAALTSDRVLARLSASLDEIAGLTQGVEPARLRAHGRHGGWSVVDVLAHLRSCSDMWGGYITLIIREDHPTVRAVNPTTWIKETNYRELEFAPSFSAFTTQRRELLALLRPLPSAGWLCSATVTGAGRPRDRTVLDFGRRLIEHERTHIKQIARLTRETEGDVWN